MIAAKKLPALRRKEILLFCLVVLSASIVRFYNYTERINFGPEQALSLIVSAEYILDKPSLLGLPNVQRQTSQGHVIYSGSLFNYSLVPLLLISDYDPLPITVWFTVLNLITGVVLFFVLKKHFSFSVSLIAAFLFLFNDFMINHSLYIWILNYLPLVGVLTLFFILEYRKVPKERYMFFIGILSGIGFNLEYLYLLTILGIGMYCLFISKNKSKTIMLFLIGGIIGNMPMILFDLRNDFYHFRTLLTYALETLAKPQQNRISPYHFFQLWPVLGLLGALGISSLRGKNKYLPFVLLGFYLYMNLTSPRVSFTEASGMKPGMNYPMIVQAAEAISADNPRMFNVANLVDLDLRGYVLRYLVRYRYHQSPRNVEEYKDIHALYVLGESSYNFQGSQPWEIYSMGRSKTEELRKLSNKYTVFKLTSLDEK